MLNFQTCIDSINEYILYPHFGPNVRELHDKKVSISGYIFQTLDLIKVIMFFQKDLLSCFFVEPEVQKR